MHFRSFPFRIPPTELTAPLRSPSWWGGDSLPLPKNLWPSASNLDRPFWGPEVRHKDKFLVTPSTANSAANKRRGRMHMLAVGGCTNAAITIKYCALCPLCSAHRRRFMSVCGLACKTCWIAARTSPRRDHIRSKQN